MERIMFLFIYFGAVDSILGNTININPKLVSYNPIPLNKVMMEYKSYVSYSYGNNFIFLTTYLLGKSCPVSPYSSVLVFTYMFHSPKLLDD